MIIHNFESSTRFHDLYHLVKLDLALVLRPKATPINLNKFSQNGFISTKFSLTPSLSLLLFISKIWSLNIPLKSKCFPVLQVVLRISLCKKKVTSQIYSILSRYLVGSIQFTEFSSSWSNLACNPHNFAKRKSDDHFSCA